MNTPIYEQETIIRINRDEEKVTVYTSDITMMTKLDKLVANSGDWYLVGSHNFAAARSRTRPTSARSR